MDVVADRNTPRFWLYSILARKRVSLYPPTSPCPPSSTIVETHVRVRVSLPVRFCTVPATSPRHRHQSNGAGWMVKPTNTSDQKGTTVGTGTRERSNRNDLFIWSDRLQQARVHTERKMEARRGVPPRRESAHSYLKQAL